MRVWDLSLAPGEVPEAHVHRLDFCFVVMRGGHLRHVHPGDPAQGEDVRYEDDQVVFLEPGEGLVHPAPRERGERALPQPRDRTWGRVR